MVLIAISTCATDPDYIASMGPFILSPNRLNVAASRARSKVILCASPSLLEVIPLDYDALEAQQRWRRLLAAANVIDLPSRLGRIL